MRGESHSVLAKAAGYAHQENNVQNRGYVGVIYEKCLLSMSKQYRRLQRQFGWLPSDHLIVKGNQTSLLVLSVPNGGCLGSLSRKCQSVLNKEVKYQHE